MAAEPQKAVGAPQLNLVGVVERLLASAAVIGALMYVLLNSLYVQFYGYFGIRTEQVGLDRLAVIGRSGVLAALVLALTGFIAVIAGMFALLRPSLLMPYRKLESSVGSLSWQLRQMFRSSRYIVLGVVLVLIMSGFMIMQLNMTVKAARIMRGENVRPITAFDALVDVRASRAEVAWLGDKAAMPAELQAPYLIYLGQGSDVAVFFSCGRTSVVVPAEHVAVYILMPDEADPAELSTVCKSWKR